MTTNYPLLFSVPQVKGEGPAVAKAAAPVSPTHSLGSVPPYLVPVYQKLAAKVEKLQLSNKVSTCTCAFMCVLVLADCYCVLE